VQNREISGFEFITIVEASTGTSANILTGVGFNCFSFRPVVDGIRREVIWAEPDFGPTSQVDMNGIPLLFPFAGRLHGHSFEFEGKRFHITGARSREGNVLHGFVISRAWRIAAQTNDSVTGEFQASIDDPSLLDQWPSDFHIQVTYRVAANQLICDVLIENPGTSNLPFGFGTHPYFRIQTYDGVISDPIVTVPANNVWVHKESLPTGAQRKVAGSEDLRSGVRFSDLQFEGVLTDLQEESDGLAHTTIDDSVSGLRIEQTFAPVLRNCVVWAPDHKKAIAIEPWSCLPNAFALNTEGVDTGLDILQPGETWATRITIAASSHRL